MTNLDGKIAVHRHILAFQHGTRQSTFHIPADHIDIDKGFTIPVLSLWTGADTVVTSANVVSEQICTGIYPTTFLVFSAKILGEITQLLIFRVANTGRKLVNLRSSDIGHMDTITNW
jgi:hypothetical protein